MNKEKEMNDEIAKVNFCRAISMIKSGNNDGINVLEMSAEGGYPEAQYLFAKMLEGGSDQPQLSFEWYRKAAEQDHHEAQRCLADLYMFGNFTEKNEKKAIEWYTKAANGGVPEAQFVLGEFYRSGSLIKKDLKVAEEWYSKSAQQGYEPAEKRLKQLRDTIQDNIQRDKSITITDSCHYEKIIDTFKKDGAFKGQTKELLINKDIQGLAQKYVTYLLRENGPIHRWGSDPENYYFQIAAHCYCAGLCVASWWLNQREKFSSNTALNELTSEDSILMANVVVPIRDTFNLEMIEDIRFDQFLDCIKESWNKKIENENESILAGLAAFFMAGATEDLNKYTTAPEYDEDDCEFEDDEVVDDMANQDNTSTFGRELLEALLDVGRKDSYVQGSAPFVPELTINIRNLIIEILAALDKENPNLKQWIKVMWCCFAGIGATVHWQLSWNELSNTGTFNLLTRERGIAAMDEYVLDLIGAPLETEEGTKITKHIQYIALLSLSSMSKHNVKDQDMLSFFIEACEAAYIYGMAFELNRLGMH